MKAKIRLITTLARLLIVVLLLTGWNRDIIDYIKKQEPIKRLGISLMVEGMKYKVIKYFNG